MVLKSVHNTFLKVINRFHLCRRRLYKYISVGKISQIGFHQIKNKIDLVSSMKQILGNDTESVILFATKDETEAILRMANLALDHNYNILGSGNKNIHPINWNKDIKSGYVWPQKFYLDLRSMTPSGADIKVPWELSRCHHLLWLGEAYILTKDERYAKVVAADLNDWIDNNPIMCTVNWTCAMEVAIRAVNWMYAILFIENSPHLDNELSRKVYLSLYQHAFFIRNNLERQIPYSNNHYTSDIVGLLYLGILFEKTRKGRRWKSFALSRFYKEVRTQVLPSGIHYEKSVSYHRLMVELHSYTAYMLQRCNIAIPSDVADLIRRMYVYSIMYTKPNGCAPMVGDNDDGRFLPFVKRDFREHAYLNDPQSLENLIVSYGYSDTYYSQSNSKASQLYCDSGFAIIKNDECYAFISHGGYSKFPKKQDMIIYTHTHNDHLSFELSIKGFDIIVDPGTYLYTSSPEDRNLFRSTSKHNTILVDNEEQNKLHTKSVFMMTRNVAYDILQMNEKKIKGSYRTLEGGLYHSREFSVIGRSFVFVDKITKSGRHHVGKLFFHFAEGLEPIICENDVVIRANNLIITLSNNSSGFIEIVEDTISPSYGVFAKTKTAILTFTFDDSVDIKTIISWKQENNIELP